jgi:hypothetical protein
MRWMRTVSVGVVVALVTVMGWAAFAKSNGGTTPVRCIDTRWRSGEITTTSTTFQKVPGLVDSPGSIFPIQIDVSATVSGAPVEFRVLNTNVGAQTDVSRPGRTRFVPADAGKNAFSYQWIEPNQQGALHVTDLRLQWRSTTGGAVHLWNGDMSVTYATERGACVGSS